MSNPSLISLVVLADYYPAERKGGFECYGDVTTIEMLAIGCASILASLVTL